MDYAQVLPAPLKFASGYINYPLELEGLPETIQVSGMALTRKSEFHCSLLCVKCLTSELEQRGQTPDQAAASLLSIFSELTKTQPLLFVGLTGELRLIKKDDRHTLVAMCEISGLRRVFQLLNAQLDMSIPLQPAHITLYTSEPDKGIGISSIEELENMSQPLAEPEVMRLKSELTIEERLLPTHG